MLVTEEWLLAFGAHKVFNVPILTQGSDHPFLDWPSACTTNGNTHFVMAPQTIQFSFDLSST